MLILVILHVILGTGTEMGIAYYNFYIIDKAIVKKHTSTESNVIIVSVVC